MRHGLRSDLGRDATELSVTDAWLEAVVGDASHIGTIRKLVCQVADVSPNIPTKPRRIAADVAKKLPGVQ